MKDEVSERLREVVERVVEMVARHQVDEIGWQVVKWLVEMNTKE